MTPAAPRIKWEPPRLAEPERTRLALGERLALIGLIEEGLKHGEDAHRVAPDLFADLWGLVRTTVSGSKIDRLEPRHAPNGFHVFEITAESGEILGRLNMIYLNKPVPCYYLVYVEVAGPYRQRGLGNRILQRFRDFLDEKSALGILDNIIPREDPTYDIYLKQAWQPIEDVLDRPPTGAENIMLYIPPRYLDRDLDGPILKLVHHLTRRRAAIEMRDNEAMVRQTIAEFKDLYVALTTYFEPELRSGASTPLMRYMFTRFTNKLNGFSRRISDLLGFTGGESLQQIVIDPRVLALPIRSYAPRELSGSTEIRHDPRGLAALLPAGMREDAGRAIGGLPNYRRPSLIVWEERTGRQSTADLTIKDLLELGFDPTRLKELTLDGQEYIFERIPARRRSEVTKKIDLMTRLAADRSGVRAGRSTLKANPPLLVLADRGHLYVLRAKMPGIHWEEAQDQLQTVPALQTLDSSLGVCRLIQGAARQAFEAAARALAIDEKTLREAASCFVSWELATNRPRLVVDFSGNYVETVWLA